MIEVLVALLGALIPTCVYVLFVWGLDRYEKEPLWLLALSFAWGAFPAANAPRRAVDLPPGES